MRKWIIPLIIVTICGCTWLVSTNVARAIAVDNFVEAITGIVDVVKAAVEAIVELFVQAKL